MGTIEQHKKQLPNHIFDLSRFVVVGREKLTAVRAEIRAINKIGIANEVREQKLAEAQMLGEAVLDAEIRIGELMSGVIGAQGRRTDLELDDTGVHKSTLKRDIIKDAGLTPKQCQRFEKMAAHPDIVQQVKDESRASGTIVTRAAVLQAIQDNAKPFIVHNSGDEEWLTPPKFIEAARTVLGKIDLDPCSTAFANSRVNATKYYSAEDDGLSHEWTGTVWLNPPYNNVDRFIKKLIDSPEVTAAITFTNSCTETKWYQALISHASAVCFPSGRTHFEKPDGSHGPCMQGQTLCYLGNHSKHFVDAFSDFGWCCKI